MRPSQRVEMAKRAVSGRKLSIRKACLTFQVSECCYHYEHKLSDKNSLIVELLLGLAQAQRTEDLVSVFSICAT